MNPESLAKTFGVHFSMQNVVSSCYAKLLIPYGWLMCGTLMKFPWMSSSLSGMLLRSPLI